MIYIFLVFNAKYNANNYNKNYNIAKEFQNLGDIFFDYKIALRPLKFNDSFYVQEKLKISYIGKKVLLPALSVAKTFKLRKL